MGVTQRSAVGLPSAQAVGGQILSDPGLLPAIPGPRSPVPHPPTSAERFPEQPWAGPAGGPRKGAACPTPPFSAVKGLVFDMGDVLYDATLWRRWLWQLLSQRGLRLSYRELFQIWDARYLVEVHRGEREYQQAFAAFLQSLNFTRGMIDEVEAASQARRRELAATLRPLPGVRTTLTQLQAAGVPMAVLSDSESTGQQLAQRLAGLGLGDSFVSVISSFDLRQTKPHPACYAAALAALSLPAAQVAFVGHDVEELDGARDAGMPTIAFNYEAGVTADVCIQRFEQLLKLVDAACPLAAA